MRHPAAVPLLILAGLLGPRASGADAPRNLLLNPGAEAGKGDQPSVWFAATGPRRLDGLRMIRATDEAHSGKASLAITYRGPIDAPIAFNWAQPLTEVPAGKTIRLRAWIKAEDAGSANVCVQCWSRDDKMLAFGSTPVFRGDQGWIEAKSEPIDVPEKTSSILVRAAMTGEGRVWFDDISVAVEEERASTKGEASRPDSDDAPRPSAVPTVVKPEGSPPLDGALTRAVAGRIVRAMLVEKDCTVLAYLPDWNHGQVDWIAVVNNNNGAKGGVRALVALPELKDEDAAPSERRFFLALYSSETTIGDKPSPIEVVELAEDWRETTSWKEMPEVAPPPVVSVPIIEEDGWKLFDVTPLVRRWAESGTKGRGVVLRFAREDVGVGGKWSGYHFISREGRANRRPALIVVEPAR